MKWKIYLAGGAVILGLAFGWFRSEIKEAEERGAREEVVKDYRELQEEHAGYRDSAEAALAEQAAESEELRVSSDSLGAELLIAQSNSRRWHERYSQIEGQLSELPDSVRQTVTETITAIGEEAKLCSLALTTCNELVSSVQAEKENLSGQLLQTRMELTAANQTIDRLEQPMGSSNLLPWAIAGISTVVLILSLVF